MKSLNSISSESPFKHFSQYKVAWLIGYVAFFCSLTLEANQLLEDDKTPDESYWKAANQHCQASRYGSAEGMCRLGLLHMLGMGVPENIAYAASLY